MPRQYARAVIRRFLLAGTVGFLTASLVHAGVLVGGYEHRQARVAESVIALVLLAGLVVSWVRPSWTRPAALAALGFAFLGTCVGLTMVAIGVGPQTTPDLVYHVAILFLLLWGLVAAAHARPPGGAEA